MESTNNILINEEYYPNLYKLYNEGWAWDNAYSPRNACSTGNNEMSGMVSLFTINNTCTANNYKDNKYPEAILGRQVSKKYDGKLPLLVKFIDAQNDLSIQVHPDDELAAKRHNTFGKTEMWYIIDAVPGATLYAGFKHKISKKEYRQRIEDGTICLHVMRCIREMCSIYRQAGCMPSVEAYCLLKSSSRAMLHTAYMTITDLDWTANHDSCIQTLQPMPSISMWRQTIVHIMAIPANTLHMSLILRSLT